MIDEALIANEGCIAPLLSGLSMTPPVEFVPAGLLDALTTLTSKLKVPRPLCMFKLAPGWLLFGLDGLKAHRNREAPVSAIVLRLCVTRN